MTLKEAIERVDRIWGATRLTSIRVQRDGGCYVELKRMGIASDTRERNYVAHHLDANGHPTCHADCKELESKL